MAAYLQWLAPQITDLKARLPDLIRIFRDDAIGAGFAGAHSRTASDYASLKAGLCLLFEFATQSGTFSPVEVGDFQERAEIALRALMARQGDNQAEEDEVRRFFALLQSASARAVAMCPTGTPKAHRNTCPMLGAGGLFLSCLARAALSSKAGRKGSALVGLTAKPFG